MDKFRKLHELIKCLILGFFTGKLTIHFNKGDIAKIEKNETLKIK